MMHRNAEITKWVFPDVTTKETCIFIFHLIGISIAKDFTPMKIDLKTRKLLKSNKRKFHIFACSRS
jgi:hypothetical protein